MNKMMKMIGVTEYTEGLAVGLEVVVRNDKLRLVVVALNEAGNNGTEVDLLELISWLKRNRPDLVM